MIKQLSIVLTFVLFLISCGGDDSADLIATYQDVQPEDIDDGLLVSHAEDEGMRVTFLEDLENDILDGKYTNMHSVLVARNNKLVFETYHAGEDVFGKFVSWKRSSVHNIHSATKSFASAFVGIALEQRNLGLDTRLFDHFPEYDFADDLMKMSITVDDALSMSNGIKWDEWSAPYEDPANSHEAMYRSGNWIDYVVNLPMEDSPGNSFRYNSGISITLGQFAANLANMSLGEFSDSYFFQPLGIKEKRWFIGPHKTYQTGGGLSITPRSMMKLDFFTKMTACGMDSKLFLVIGFLLLLHSKGQMQVTDIIGGLPLTM